MSPTVAVVIPTRNRSGLLAEALASVMAQTRPPQEVIVVDDASDGEHRDVMDRLESVYPKVRFIRLPRRQGGAVARNVGWRSAASDLIAFLDDDDVWHAQKLERQVPALASGGVEFSWTGIHAQRRSDGRSMGEHESRNVRFADLLVRSELWCSTLLVRRETLRRVGGFDESLSRNQDWDLYLRLFRQHRGKNVPGSWTTARWGRPDARACIEGREAFFVKWRDEIERLPSSQRRRARFMHHWFLWGNLAQLGDVRGEWAALRSMAPLGWSQGLFWRSLALTVLHTGGWRGRNAGRDPY